MRTVSRGLLLLVIGLAGCSAPDPVAENEKHFADVIATPLWRLESQTLNGTQLLPPAQCATTLKATGKDLSGDTGCNRYSMEYVATPTGAISFGEGGVTEMACDFLDHEANFMAGWAKVNRYEVKDGSLILSDGSANNQLVFVPYQPKITPLRATTWRLSHFTQSSNDVDSAESVSATVTMILNEDELSGSGGCNQYRCDATTPGGDRIQIEAPVATRKSCPDAVMKAERRFFELLPKMTRFRISENTLTLSNTDGAVGMQFEGQAAGSQ